MSKYTTKAALKAAIAKFAKDGGTDAEITAIKDSAVALEATADLPTEGALAVQPDVTAKMAELTKNVAVLSLSADMRKHYDGLDAAGQTAFLAKSDADKAADLAKAEEAAKGDPVVYKTADGTEIRKSDGAVALMMAKNFDSLNAKVDGILTESADEKFGKIAKAEFGNLPFDGTVEMLKAADAITDADKKKRFLDAMRANNKAAGPAFKRLGGGGSVVKSAGGQVEPDSTEGSTAEDKLDELAKARMVEKSITFEKAYSEVMDTDEGKSLYLETINDDRFQPE